MKRLLIKYAPKHQPNKKARIRRENYLQALLHDHVDLKQYFDPNNAREVQSIMVDDIHSEKPENEISELNSLTNEYYFLTGQTEPLLYPVIYLIGLKTQKMMYYTLSLLLNLALMH